MMTPTRTPISILDTQDRPAQAFYLDRMVLRRDAAGRPFGGQLIDFAEGHDAALALRWLRLNGWRTNTTLHAYCERHGLERVRTVTFAPRRSGARLRRVVDGSRATTVSISLRRVDDIRRWWWPKAGHHYEVVVDGAEAQTLSLSQLDKLLEGCRFPADFWGCVDAANEAHRRGSSLFVQWPTGTPTEG